MVESELVPTERAGIDVKVEDVGAGPGTIKISATGNIEAAADPGFVALRAESKFVRLSAEVPLAISEFALMPAGSSVESAERFPAASLERVDVRSNTGSAGSEGSAVKYGEATSGCEGAVGGLAAKTRVDVVVANCVSGGTDASVVASEFAIEEADEDAADPVVVASAAGGTDRVTLAIRLGSFHASGNKAGSDATDTPIAVDAGGAP